MRWPLHAGRLHDDGAGHRSSDLGAGLSASTSAANRRSATQGPLPRAALEVIGPVVYLTGVW